MLHQAIAIAAPGDILVASVAGYTEAGAWGEITSTAAKVRGIEGLVIDGGIRDSAEIRKLNFPIFAKSICIKATVKEILA